MKVFQGGRMKNSSRIVPFLILVALGSLPACATLPTNFERLPSSALADTQDTYFGTGGVKEASYSSRPVRILNAA